MIQFHSPNNNKLQLKFVIVLFLFLLVFYATPKLSAQSSSTIFTDITKQAGIDFRYTFGDKNY